MLASCVNRPDVVSTNDNANRSGSTMSSPNSTTQSNEAETDPNPASSGETTPIYDDVVKSTGEGDPMNHTEVTHSSSE